MRRKAQTATEYLIILAVVIIIALIVVGVMGGIPGIGGGAKERTSRAYWSTADVAFTAYSVDSSGVTLNTRNNMERSVTVNSISLGGTDLGISATTLTAGGAHTFTSGAVTCTSGSFSYTVSVSYTVIDTNATFTFDGDGQTLDGTCAT